MIFRQRARQHRRVRAGSRSSPRCQQAYLRCAERIQIRQQFGAHRHRHFGGRRRRRRAPVGGKIDQRDVGLVADRGNQRDHAGGRRAHHDLLVERPQVLERTAAARDDDQIRARQRPAFRQRVEAFDRVGDFAGRGLALHAHRPDQHAARKAVGQPMQNVADDRAGRRRHDADHLGQERNELLARLVEQAFGGELLLALLQQLHQRADAGGLQAVDHDLVFRRAREGGELAGDDDVEALFGLDPHAAVDALPDHAFQHGAVVLQPEVAMPGGRRPLEAGDLAAHPHEAIGVLDRALERARTARKRSIPQRC